VATFPGGELDYHEQATGTGATIVLVPGSWSTGGAWKGVVAAMVRGGRVVTTSLPGYGGSVERRVGDDVSIDRVAEAIEAVVARTGDDPVHLVGHSFGGLACLAVARRGQVPLASLTIFEATAFDALRRADDAEGYAQVVAMVDAYRTRFAAGDVEAARSIIDFYGGDGSFDGLPPRVRDYVVATTSTNVLDWSSAFADRGELADYRALTVPTLVVHGEFGHPLVARAARIVAEATGAGRLAVVPGASHFMLSTHPEAVAALIDEQVGATT
jgi:pimeloyl-ACP methyl ester carboxylesterase